MHRPKINRLFEVMQISGVKVFVHWSVLLISAIILVGAFDDPWLSITVLLSYYAVILIHECGHLIAARRVHCKVWSIELYPLWGITRFDEPYSRFDHGVIAWSGVLAQAVIAIPLVLWGRAAIISRFQPVNAMVVILGYFSLGVAAINLLPVPPLDGAIAWRLLPELFKRPSGRPTKREAGWRSWR
jgi:Zn-dependent protease